MTRKLTKAWCREAAQREAGQEVGAGSPEGFAAKLSRASEKQASQGKSSLAERAGRPLKVDALRQKLGLSLEAFSEKFHLPLETVRKWEDGTKRPDQAARLLLQVIATESAAVERALRSPPR